MRMFKRICCGTFLLCLLCFLCVILHEYVFADEVQSEVYPDGCGGFYLLENHRDRYVLFRVKKDGSNGVMSAENKHIDHVFSCSDRCCLISQDEMFLSVINVARKTDVSIIENVRIKGNCVTVAGDRELYLCDEGSPNEIKIYSDLESLSGTVMLDRNIRMLFTDMAGNAPYAVVDGGLYDVLRDVFVPCKIPAVPFKQNEGCYTDSSGSLYSFSSETGFTKLITVDYESLCYMNDKLFGVRDGTIYMLDLSGRKLSCFTPDEVINDMYTSGSSLAILSGSELISVDVSLFVPCEEEQSSEAAVSEPVSSIPDASEESAVKTSSSVVSEKSEISLEDSSRTNTCTSKICTSTEVTDVSETSGVMSSEENADTDLQIGEISSSVYTIANGMITGVPDGTTIAVLKKNMEFHGYTVSFVDNNGKSVTGGILGTGYTVSFCSSVKNESYTIVIMGDLTGEGKLNSNDILALSKYLSGESTLDEYKLFAADINHDGNVDIQDLYMYQREYLLSGKEIEHGKFTV